MEKGSVSEGTRGGMSAASKTAQICAFARAHHSIYSSDKIFDDTLAFDLLGRSGYDEMLDFLTCDDVASCLPVHELKAAAGKDGARPSFETSSKACPLISHYLSPILLPRISYAEGELHDFVQRNGTCQYVICGAGMDTFSFRNDNPRIRIFELDHPYTQTFKKARIDQLEWHVADNVRFVPIDFTTDDVREVLVDAGFDPELPSFLTIMGVAYYLDLSAFESNVAALSSLMRPGSRLVFDFPDHTLGEAGDGTERIRRLARFTAQLDEPMSSGYALDDLERVLLRHGLDIETHLAPPDIQSRFFDARGDGQTAYENVHFMTVTKRREG